MREKIEGDSGPQDPASSTMKVARKASGTIEIDVRAGFEGVTRSCLENVLTCYREASAARALGDETEANALIELAEQALDLAHATLCKIESL